MVLLGTIYLLSLLLIGRISYAYTDMEMHYVYHSLKKKQPKKPKNAQSLEQKN